MEVAPTLKELLHSSSPKFCDKIDWNIVLEEFKEELKKGPESPASHYFPKYYNDFHTPQPLYNSSYPDLPDSIHEDITAAQFTQPTPRENTSTMRGFGSENPYASHPWWITARQKKIAAVYRTLALKAINSDSNAPTEVEAEQVLGRYPDIAEELKKLIPVLPHFIPALREAHREFARELLTRTHVTFQDKQIILDALPGIRVRPLLEDVLTPASQWIIQEALVEPDQFWTHLTQTYLYCKLYPGFAVSLDLLNYHVTPYTRLFREFDQMRKTEKILEVYVGRDGQHAYEARLAQDIARRSHAPAGQRTRLDLVYIVYPTLFRNYFNPQVLLEYLHQRGISQEANPYVFDTGYIGSIPAQILDLLGFTEEEREKRIRLASTSARKNRQIIDLSENENSPAGFIENTAKA